MNFGGSILFYFFLQNKKIVGFGETAGFLADEKDRGAKTQLRDVVYLFPRERGRGAGGFSPRQPGAKPPQMRAAGRSRVFWGGELPPTAKRGFSLSGQALQIIPCKPYFLS